MDPRQIKPANERLDQRSPLMKAKEADRTGEGVNFCPFGCEQDDMDDHGYCDHLIGFSNDGKTYEPMVKDERGHRVVRGGRPAPVQRTDKLVQITTSSRVYRDTKEEKLKTA